MRLPLLHRPLGSLSDDALMQRVKGEGDDGAYSVLYRRHARRVMGFFFRQTDRDEALAADLTQDAFLRIWLSRDKYAGSGFRTWLYTIAYNLLRNHIRHAVYRQEYEADALLGQDVTTETKAQEQLEGKEFDLALQCELEKLPAEGRLLFSLRFEEELTVPQIATVLGIPEGTVKSRLHTLTQTLKQKLNHHDNV